MRKLAAALIVLLLASPSSAAEGEAVLRFRDGRLLPGTVVELREEGVLHRTERGTVLWKWSDLTPFSSYEVRASVLDEDDGVGRFNLAKWCLDAGLPGEARTELQRARALGAGDAAELDSLLESCDEREATAAFAEADTHVAAGDLESALKVLKSYLVRAPASTWTEDARGRASDLVRRMELDAERRRLDAESDRKDRDAAKRLKYIADTIEEADEERTRASRTALSALREETGGSFTRFRNYLEETAQRYLKARTLYERARRSAGDGHPDEARIALSSRRSVEGRLLDVYLRLARSLVDQKSWEAAQAAIDRALRLDPVNAEALDLQETVKKNWIRRKASGLTNAQGQSSDGTGGNR
jgi:tetratricopeptide (TPR) repeat protein